jgi:hypothetical protein
MAMVNRAPKGSKYHVDPHEFVAFPLMLTKNRDMEIPLFPKIKLGWQHLNLQNPMSLCKLRFSGVARTMLTPLFRQTPTFNATPVVEAALEACRRGVLVEIYADLGFNDEVSYDCS